MELAEGKIDAQYGEAVLGECGCDLYQERCLGVRSGAVGEHQDLACRMDGLMQEAAYGRVG